ncbi:Nucleolar protein [Musa troglodytarum]|uniref:Nucleolar protein n=1 Tax=Musa troglodytarum TaxID=320322 RepID=A0A9E7EFK6_9LILI|nr:Nucleolar protein [Musa troglodytarum]
MAAKGGGNIRSTSIDGVKLYSLSGQRFLATLASSQEAQSPSQRQRFFINQQLDYLKRVDLIQDLGFETATTKLKVTPDGDYAIASVKMFELRELSLEFGRHLVSEIINFQGENTTSIEPNCGAINDICVFNESGLMLLALDSSQLPAYFVPALGPAPKWYSQRLWWILLHMMNTERDSRKRRWRLSKPHIQKRLAKVNRLLATRLHFAGESEMENMDDTVAQKKSKKNRGLTSEILRDTRFAAMFENKDF